MHVSRSDSKLLKENEDEHKKLDQDRTSGSRHVHARDAVVVVFHPIARI